jgi:hypothetical protein
MALPLLPFGRRASQGAVTQIAPPDVDANSNAYLFDQKRNNQYAVATQNIWAHAVPCPYKYWMTVEPFDQSNVYTIPSAYRSSSFPIKTDEIPSGKYFLPYFELNGGRSSYYFDGDYSGGTRSFTVTLLVGSRISFRIPVAADDISVSITIGGTGGYSVTRNYPRTSQMDYLYVTVEAYIPIPWDEDRAISVSWTGGGSSINSSDPTAYAVNGIVLTTDIPGGSVATDTWDGRRGSVKSGESAAAMPRTATAIGEHHRVRPWGAGDGMYRQVYDAGYGGNRLMTYRSEGSVLGTFGMRSLAYTPLPGPVYGASHVRFPDPSEDDVPYRCLPVRHDGSYKVTTVLKPNYIGYINLRRCVRFYFGITYNVSGTYTLRLYRGATWSSDMTTRTTLATMTISHTASPLTRYYLYTGTYPMGPDADGAWTGLARVECTNNGSVQAGGWAIDDYFPSPITIPTTDGKAIPASVVEASLVNAKWAEEVAVTGTAFPFSAIPSDIGLYCMRYDAVPRGMYYAIGKDAGGADYGATMYMWGQSKVTADGGAFNSSFLVEDGDPVYMVPPSVWGNYKKATNTNRVLDSCNLVSLVPVHNALALGDQDIAVSYSVAGWASSADATAGRMLFQKFTAPAAGNYEFKLWSGVQWASQYNFGIWASTDDQLCIHDIPDATEVGLCNQVSIYTFVAEPPALSGVAGLRQYIVDAGINAFAGQDGKLAQGYYCGDNTVPIKWRFRTLPQGWNVQRQSDSKFYRLEGSAWVLRQTSLVTYRAALANGQTIYLRVSVARASTVRLPPRYGGAGIGAGSANYARMTVTAV